MSTIDEQIDKLTRRKKRARTFAEKQRIDVEIARLKAQKSRRREIPKNMKFGGPQDQFQILNKNMQPPLPREKPTPPMQKKDSNLVGSGARLKGFGYGDKSPQFLGNLDLNRAKSIRPDDDRDMLERSIKSAPEDKNIVEQLVSKLLGRNIRFEDIPDDDPDFDQGLKSEGHIAYPAGRPDLRMGGMTARSAATTKFKKPLGMKGGGNITRAQRQRIARIMQDYKQKKARKSNGKRTNR